MKPILLPNLTRIDKVELYCGCEFSSHRWFEPGFPKYFLKMMNKHSNCIYHNSKTLFNYSHKIFKVGISSNSFKIPY